MAEIKDSVSMIIDEAYEFCAPQFFNFVDQESHVDIGMAELWFDTSLGYGPSPYLNYIKLEKSESVCTRQHTSIKTEKPCSTLAIDRSSCSAQASPNVKVKSENQPTEKPSPIQATDRSSCNTQACPIVKVKSENQPIITEKTSSTLAFDQSSCSTLACPIVKVKSENQPITTKKPSSTLAIGQSSCRTRACPIFKVKSENQPIKRQKLEGGHSKEIHDMKQRTYAHKTNKNTQSAAAGMERKPWLTLTRPKSPKFQTSERVRSSTVKSTAEMEEELMSKIPKFKARTVNKKILETPTLPPLPRSQPHLPVFKEFHLSMRANNVNSEESTIESTDSSHRRKLHSGEPKPPILHTSFRTRPITAKSSQELELEELEKAPKFKALPFNKKIFDESKGGSFGVFSNKKLSSTKPQEFHFAVEERIPPHKSVSDLFNSISLDSESHNRPRILRNTAPVPFHLHTEERGAEKERKLAMELMQKKLEEEQARVPKATPYPWSTDFPTFPPKPEAKQCTIPTPFQLESLARHEEEMQREREERERMEREEAQMRIFKAQPVLKKDPIPIPEKERKPLTVIEEFELHVNQRAVERAEFEKMIQEKQMCYKRMREEHEAARMMEEEKTLKQLRRKLIHHASEVPDFNNPFVPQRSTKETTKAKSPNFLVDKREKRMNVAFSMR